MRGPCDAWAARHASGLVHTCGCLVCGQRCSAGHHVASCCIMATYAWIHMHGCLERVHPRPYAWIQGMAGVRLAIDEISAAAERSSHPLRHPDDPLDDLYSFSIAESLTTHAGQVFQKLCPSSCRAGFARGAMPAHLLEVNKCKICITLHLPVAAALGPCQPIC